MDTYLLLALTGLGIGSVYAAIGLSVVVTYRGTGVINFAAGAMGMWTAFVFDELARKGDLVLPLLLVPHRAHIGHVAFAPALAIALTEAVALGLLAHFVIFRPLHGRPILAKVVASVGLMLTLQALVVLRFGSAQRVPQAIFDNAPVSILGQSVPRDRLWLTATVAAVSVLLWAYFRYSRLGIATRAAAENERFVVLAGLSPDLLAGITWTVSSFTVGLLLTLATPLVQLNATFFVLAIVPALAAALVARFSSLAIVAVTGLAIGSIQSVLAFTAAKPWWPDWAKVGFTDAFPFVVVIVALFAVGRSIPSRGDAGSDSLPPVMRPVIRPIVVASAIALGAVAVLATDGSYRFGVITSMIVALIALSLVVLTGLVGQISLAQAALAGTAGFVLSWLADGVGIPFPISTLLAAIAATAFGVIVGIPALRIRGAQLAVVTLAGAVTLERFVFNNPKLKNAAGNKIPDPSLFGINLGVREGTTTARWQFGLLVLFVLAVCALGVANLIRSETGRRFLAVRSNERASAAAGISVASTKLLAFAMASFLAGIAGSFIGYSRGQLSAESFSTLTGVSFLVFAYLGGITSISGAVVAGTLAPLGIGFVMMDRWLNVADKYLLFSGLALIATAIFNPEGIAGGIRSKATALRSHARGRQPSSDAGSPEPTVDASPNLAPIRVDRSVPVLETRDLTVRYGGVTAANAVSLRVNAGQIVGLIGPNGAGKTSIIDAITGFTSASGHVLLCGDDISKLQPHRRARNGLARTWQSVELFRDLSIHDNLEVVTSRPSISSVAQDIVRPKRRSTTHFAWALDLFGLTDLRDRQPHELPLGQQKLIGVARALASHPSVVLLDEPAAGLDTTETAALAQHIEAIAATGTGVLLVDHDMGLVLDICQHIYVLEFGELIADDPPDLVRRDARVIAAYLGEQPPAAVAILHEGSR